MKLISINLLNLLLSKFTLKCNLKLPPHERKTLLSRFLIALIGLSSILNHEYFCILLDARMLMLGNCTLDFSLHGYTFLMLYMNFIMSTFYNFNPQTKFLNQPMLRGHKNEILPIQDSIPVNTTSFR